MNLDAGGKTFLPDGRPDRSDQRGVRPGSEHRHLPADVRQPRLQRVRVTGPRREPTVTQIFRLHGNLPILHHVRVSLSKHGINDKEHHRWQHLRILEILSH